MIGVGKEWLCRMTYAQGNYSNRNLRRRAPRIPRPEDRLKCRVWASAAAKTLVLCLAAARHVAIAVAYGGRTDIGPGGSKRRFCRSFAVVHSGPANGRFSR